MSDRLNPWGTAKRSQYRMGPAQSELRRRLFSLMPRTN